MIMFCLKKNGIKVNYILIIIFLLFCYSCEKLFMEPDSPSDPEAIFEEIWTFTDTHYSFFEYKNVDWDEVYDDYRPKIDEDMGAVELFDVCADMLYELKDGHVNLVSAFDRSRYWEWYLDSPENFYYSIIERYYFDGDQRYLGPLQFLDMGDIIYVYYGSFGNTISEGHMDALVSNLENKEGLIIDVRNNGGGSPDNGRKLASRFTEVKRFAGYNLVKQGPGHEDFTREEVYIHPYDGDRFTGNVVVLTNRRSYSATTYFTHYMSVLGDNVTLVGDTTGGGGGLPAVRDLPNGWLLRVSSSRFYCPEGVNIESGIPPDIQIDINEEEAFARREDPIIEKAIEVILDK